MTWAPAPPRLIEALASAARTTAASPHNSDTLESKGRRGVVMHVDITLDPDTVAIVAKLQGYNEQADAWYDIAGAATASLNAVGHTTLVVYPGIAATANAEVSQVLPSKFRVVVTHTGGTTLTYAVYLELLP